MKDVFPEFFPWFEGMFRRPIPETFDRSSEEYLIVKRLTDEWGRKDTASLLRGLTDQYGKKACEAVEKLLEHHIVSDWEQIGKKESSPGSEMDDFIRVLWEPLKNSGFVFTVSGDDKRKEFCVTRCPMYELAEKTGLHDWIYTFACATDYFSTRGFSGNLGFSRTKTLVTGDGCCDHTYFYR